MVMALAVVGCSNPSSGNEFPLDSQGEVEIRLEQVTLELTTAHVK